MQRVLHFQVGGLKPQRADQARHGGELRGYEVAGAQGLFAHATTPRAATIAVALAKAARYKNICASGLENVCTLLATSPTQSERWCSPPCLHG